MFEQSESDSKRLKATGSNENHESGGDGEGNSGKSADQPAKSAEPPKDYIHVRARRGQATDSHSLAERVILPHYFHHSHFLTRPLIFQMHYGIMWKSQNLELMVLYEQ